MAAAFEDLGAVAAVATAMPAEHVAVHVPAPEPTPGPMKSLRTAQDLSSPRTRTGDVLLAEPADFESLLLSRSVLEGLRAAGFERPSPVQLKAIPLGRCGLGESGGPGEVGGRGGRRETEGRRRRPGPHCSSGRALGRLPEQGPAWG